MISIRHLASRAAIPFLESKQQNTNGSLVSVCWRESRFLVITVSFTLYAGRRTRSNRASIIKRCQRRISAGDVFFEKTNSCEKCGKKSHKMRIKSNKTANFPRKFSRIQKKIMIFFRNWKKTLALCGKNGYNNKHTKHIYPIRQIGYIEYGRR